MSAMTQVQIEEFLAAPRHAVVGTNVRDGAPQLSPVWYLYEDGRFYISITDDTAKYHNLQRDPRISLCIDGGYPDFRTVIVYGRAAFIPHGEPPQEEMRWRIIRHYHESEEAARRYAQSTKDDPSLLVVVTPDKILSQDFN